MKAVLPAELARDGHRVMVYHWQSGPRDPGWHEASCTCGWNGSTWDCPPDVVDAVAGEEGGLSPWHERYMHACTGSLISPGSEARTGGKDEAINEALRHLQTSPQQASLQANQLLAAQEEQLRDTLRQAARPGASASSSAAHVARAYAARQVAQDLADLLDSLHAGKER